MSGAVPLSLMVVTTTGLAPSPSAGPAEVLRGLLLALDSRGYDGTVFVTGGASCPEDADFAQFSVLRLVSRDGLVQRLRERWTHGRAMLRSLPEHDILLFNSPPHLPGLVLACLARLIGRPVVLVVHGGVFLEEQHLWGRRVHRRMLSACRRVFSMVLCVSSWTAALAAPEMGAERIRVVRNGYTPAANGSVAHREGFQRRPTILFLGRLESVKRPMDAIDALSLLGDDVQADLVIAGAGRLRGDLEGAAIRSGLESRIRFAGHVVGEDKRRVLEDARILILPSEAEPFGLVILEAWSAGLAVVAADTGGIPEVIEHERTGILVRVGDVRGYAEALRRLLSDEELCRALASAGERRLREYFTWDRAGDEYDELLRALID